MKDIFKKLLTGIAIGLGIAVGLSIYMSIYEAYTETPTKKGDGITVQKPDFFSIEQDRILKTGHWVVVTAKVTNNSEYAWDNVEIIANVFDEKGFLDDCADYFGPIEPGKSVYVTAECTVLRLEEIAKDIKLTHEIYIEKSSRKNT